MVNVITYLAVVGALSSAALAILPASARRPFLVTVAVASILWLAMGAPLDSPPRGE